MLMHLQQMRTRIEKVSKGLLTKAKGRKSQSFLMTIPPPKKARPRRRFLYVPNVGRDFTKNKITSKKSFFFLSFRK